MFRYFENLVNPFAAHEGGTPPAALWPFMTSQFGPFRKWMVWMALTGVLVALIETGLIFYTGRVVDLMNASERQSFWSSHGWELLAAALFILILRPVAIVWNRFFLEQTLAGNMQEQVRWRAHKHMLGQSLSFFQNDFAGRLSNRVMQLGPAVEDSTYMFFEGIFYATTYVLSAMLILGSVDWRLSLPLAIWLVLYIAYTRHIARRVAVASEKWSDARSLVNGRVVDAYANIESVKLFAQGAGEERYVLSAMRRLRLRFMRFLRLMTELSFGLNILNGMLITGVLGPALWLWTAGLISVGEVAAASALTVRLNGMSGWIMWVTIRLFEHAGVIREGLRSIAVPHELVDAPGATRLQIDRGEIRFDALTHHYGRGKGGLDNVSITVKPGEKVGLVGRSGAGKSSLVNLLLRFRDPEGGRILIDGQDVAQVTQDSLRAQIGMVTQDSSLLHRSVRANILYGRPDADEAMMVAAARRAEAHEFIQTLEDPQGRRGYNAHVGERGVKLSGGQRQRVAIARVMLKDAPILVLDEATSALDSEVEAAIQKTLYGMMEGKTVMAIAHRLSTIAEMDRVIVLDQGRVIEQGTHDELLALGGTYAGLWERQSGGFLAEE
ncbi:putative multidrug export ATP-binding/permease protein [Aliiroseovarius sp. xm-m-379]|uniref:ABC transporter ATP-binding protein n=1 Tax=unclassified Aliiroseovarius TaxID=2623558 RepID=UPI001567CCCA|nr:MULTISPECIES: ABC transporter ATP-binding protein [unclassified Aliiroseovarius]NRP13902.1 putative multidrug export ATP-binding/permease protein [Aliiroseovarius sp. xm-d-517]NRP25453.1 putative multidrug export ATP-binding/permease protein [Aliiroseovarius sp. xm-m-379]NRP29445.1 putative multidrug export ATP-binding/permease protein [Aliiroseovarius sp. xm-m-314]NRP34252.1 putative multidrug export ATP-binding/permease protein [Aliiroseovarius sp. xm-a-104]NRP41789.1 putative multidrug e